MALEALEAETEKDRLVEKIVSERDKLKSSLNLINFVKKVYPSDANFLLAKLDEATKVYEYLLLKKIIVRNRSNLLHCENCLRFTIGTEDQNIKLLEALREYGV
jgi:histidinol-phosphate aminotransferase